MVANLSSPERQHPCSQSPAPPAPPRPQPRAAPSSPRPPGLAGLAAHHPRARPELRRVGARSCLWRYRQVEASTLRGPSGRAVTNHGGEGRKLSPPHLLGLGGGRSQSSPQARKLPPPPLQPGPVLALG